MAKEEVVVEVSADIHDIVKQLIPMYPSMLSEVNPDQVLCLTSTKKSKAVADIIAVKSPYDAIIKQKFIITVYSKVYDNQDVAKQHLHVFKQLLRIDNFEKGKLRKYDVQDFYEIVAKFGANWEELPTIPDVMAGPTSNQP